MQLRPHSERIFSIDGFLAPQECTELIALAAGHGYEPAGVRTSGGAKALPHIRNNERAQFPAPQWVNLLWERLALVGLPELDGQAAAGLPAALRFYRYAPEERFRMHKDGPWMENGLTSKLTLLVYHQ